MTGRKRPFERSVIDETESLCRSRLFGVMTISGFRSARSICRRSMWNICAGVEGTQTWWFISARELQETLEARRAVLGALPFVAVRQEQRNARDPAPLRLA